MIGITNASPIIYLGKIGAIYLLKQNFDQLYSTQEVIEEVLRKEQSPEIPIITQFINKNIKIRNPTNNHLVDQIESLQIHRGEATIIVLSNEISSSEFKPVLIIDDLAAREVCKAMNLQITGTVGIILRSIRKKYVSAKRGQILIDRLCFETTFRISAHLYQKIAKIISSLL
ncbi:MAG: hypothetical protein ACTSYI_14740 [Promethearchaeota archaeon]